MYRIYKYHVRRAPGEYLTTMPLGAKILSVGFQPETPGLITIWALVRTDWIEKERWFAVCFTGNSSLDETVAKSQYVGTLQDTDGLVYHVFTESFQS